MEVYRSGHNEAVLKTVWVKAHGGSNPSSCAIKYEVCSYRLRIFLSLIFIFLNHKKSTPSKVKPTFEGVYTYLFFK